MLAILKSPIFSESCKKKKGLACAIVHSKLCWPTLNCFQLIMLGNILKLCPQMIKKTPPQTFKIKKQWLVVWFPQPPSFDQGFSITAIFQNHAKTWTQLVSWLPLLSLLRGSEIVQNNLNTILWHSELKCQFLCEIRECSNLGSLLICLTKLDLLHFWHTFFCKAIFSI